MTGDVAWVDGRIARADEPALPVTDRGFQLGDGLFETLRVRRGVPIEWAEHHDRLVAGARALGIRLPAETVLLEGLGALLEAAGLNRSRGPGEGDASVRLTISRGALPVRGALPSGWSAVTPTVVIQAWRFSPPPAALLDRGVRAITATARIDPASPLAGVKTTSRAESVHARLEADRAGADDALYRTIDGQLAEATSANLFALLGRRLVTPPLAAGILPGTTRTWLLESDAAASCGLAPEEARLGPDELFDADEAFLSSSVAGIVPLVALDGRAIGDGRPGRVTRALRDAREHWIDEQSLDPAGRPGRAL